ncbi:MAG: tetratricopeptide repeat protein, partial [Clostridiales bacterium]|nr:tetratricopeptide repeat protein [Clostridiales bacterium]
MAKINKSDVLVMLTEAVKLAATVVPGMSMISAGIDFVSKVGGNIKDIKEKTAISQTIDEAVKAILEKYPKEKAERISEAFLKNADGEHKKRKSFSGKKKAPKDCLFTDFIEYVQNSLDNDIDGFIEDLPKYGLISDIQETVKVIFKGLVNIVNEAVAGTLSQSGKAAVRILIGKSDEILEEVKKLNTPQKEAPQKYFDDAIFQRNKDFTGREGLLNGIYANLAQGGEKPQIISGIGGVGKSQVALEYIHGHKEEYTDIVWIYAETKDGILNGYRKFGADKGIINDKEEPDILIRKVFNYLYNNDKWLLVYDNAEDEKLLQEILPKSGKGHIIITTRKSGAALKSIGHLHELGLFTSSEAKAYLKKRTGQDDPDGAERLAKEMGYLPLALEQAAAYILENGKSYDEYISLYNRVGDDAFTANAGIYEKTVYKTFMLSVDKLGDSAKQILYLCAYYSPDGISKKTFFEKNGYLPEPLASDIKDEIKSDRAFSELKKYSLIKVDNGKISLHRLLQDAVRASLKDDKTYIEACLNHAEELKFDYSTFDGRAFFTETEAHLVSVADNGKKVLHDNVRIGDIYHEVGFGKYEFAYYGEALEYYNKALEIKEKVLEKDNPSTAATYNSIGAVYRSQGEYPKALEYYNKAVKIREKVLEKYNPSTATSYNNIGGVYYSQGEYPKALEYYNKALEINEKVLEKDNPSTATLYNNIGNVYARQGEYPKDLEYYNKALDIQEKVLGKDNPSTATTYNNVGVVYQSQGEYPKALEYHFKALEIREKVLGKDNPYTAGSYNNISGVYYSQGEYPKALEYYNKALEIYEKVLGKDNPSTATTYNNIGEVYRSQGEYPKALEYHFKALEIREKVLG